MNKDIFPSLRVHIFLFETHIKYMRKEVSLHMRQIMFLFLICLTLLITSACGGEASSGNENNYDGTKKMVVDILQTEDGKKALVELMADEKIKKELVIESDVVKDSINSALASEEGSDMWEKLFEDPSFVEKFAKSMEEEQKKLMKQLMNDADYQKQMLELLQNPEIDEQMLKVMKSQQFRAHLEETIQSTLETPLFQAKMSEVLLKAAEKQQGKENEEQGKEGGGESKEGGEGEQGDEGEGGGGE